GVATPPPGSLPPATPTNTSTLLGIATAKSPPSIPLGKLNVQTKRPSGPPPLPPSTTPATPPPIPRERPSALMRAIDEADVIPPSPTSLIAAPPPPAPKRSRAPWVIVGVLGVAALGIGGWYAYGELVAPAQHVTSTKVVAGTHARDAATAVTATSDATVAATV